MRPNTEREPENLKSPHLTGNDDADNEKDKDKLTGTSPTDDDGANHILPGGNTSPSSTATATAKADNIDGTLNKEDVRQTISFPLSNPRRLLSLVSNLTPYSEDEESQRKTVSNAIGPHHDSTFSLLSASAPPVLGGVHPSLMRTMGKMKNSAFSRRASSAKAQRRGSNMSLLSNLMQDPDESDDRLLVKIFKRIGFNTDGPLLKFYFLFLVIPVVISIVYSVAILFPPGWRNRVPFILWTEGALAPNDEGILTLCPRSSICSEGAFQIVLISISRLTAFGTYTIMAHTFLTKMHCTIHALSVSFVGTMVPFSQLHHVHPLTGRWYAILAVVHTITHLIRWIVRSDMKLTGSQVGVTGIIGVLSIVGTVWSMSSGRFGAKAIKRMKFENRFKIHLWLMTLLVAALCFHTPRCRIITAIFGGMWFLDFLYGYVFKTYRLDLVEFSPLPSGSGVQMLWRNPRGFNANSGEYVKVQLPWLQTGGDQWHPFSLYLQEATSEGLDEVLKKKYEMESQRVHSGEEKVKPSKTALLLIDFQNEFASVGGKLHENVKGVMESTQMLQKTIDLATLARARGAQVFHAPVMLDEDGSDNPNKNLGILKNCNDDKHFVKGSWNAKIIKSHMPKANDVVIKGKHGMDCFIGTNLQEKLEAHGITTIVLGGFLTNAGVESTMRTAYEKGFNVIALTDGTACCSEGEQSASINHTYKMFSIPMTCEEALRVIRGAVPRRISMQFQSTFQDTADDEESVLKSLVHTDLNHFIVNAFESDKGAEEVSLIMGEAREQIRSQHNTTQIFIVPTGDWTKQVYNECCSRTQLRSCWVRGPYVSPYAVASDFSHLVLLATGIGITPALGVIGQYKGSSRMKTLVWSTRCPRMLKFFAPLLSDCHVSIIYYTGKERLSNAEVRRLTSNGKLFIQQSRPESLTGTVSTLITTTESLFTGKYFSSIDRIPLKSRKHWCMLYCGGSKRIRDQFQDFSSEKHINFEYELFDW